MHQYIHKLHNGPSIVSKIKTGKLVGNIISTVRKVIVPEYSPKFCGYIESLWAV